MEIFNQQKSRNTVNPVSVWVKRMAGMILLSLLVNTVWSQCPNNLNFSYNNLSYWTYYLQTYNGATNANTTNASYNLPPAGVTSVDKLLEQTSATEYAIKIFANTGASQSSDAIATAIKTVPNINGYQYDYSIKLGNTVTNQKVRKMVYTINVPSGATAYTITYAYALVLQDPSHAWDQQPRFTATVRDPSKVVGQDTIKCASVSYFVPSAAADKTAQNFVQTTSNSGIYYKDWSEASVDISGYAGKTIIIEFESDDCSQGGHYGYAYFALRNDGCSAGSIAGNNVICNSGSYLYSTPPVVGATYTWTLPSGWSGTSTTNAITVTPNNNSGYVTVTPSKSCGSVQTRSLKITTTPTVPPTPGTISGPGSLCNNSSELTYSINTVSNTSSYVWTIPSGWTIVKGGTDTSIVVTANSSSGNISVVAKNGCGVSSASSAPLIVVNSPASVGGTAAGGTSVCAGTNVSLTSSGNTGTIQGWQNSSDGGSSWSDIASSNSSGYTVTNPAVSALYRIKVQSGICPVAYSTPATVTVNALPSITYHPSNVGICSAGNTSFNVSATGAGLTYQWQRYNGTSWTNITAASTPSDGVSYGGYTTATLTLSAAPVGINNFQYRCVVSGTCTPSITSNAATLTVSTASASVTTNPSSISLCQGSQANLSIAASGTNLTYQWYSNSANSNTGGTMISGETQNSYSFSAATAGVKYYYCVASSTCSATTVTSASSTAGVTVNTANNVSVTISTNPSSSICAGTNTAFTANPTNGGSAPVYTWTKNNITVGSNTVTYSDNALSSGDVIGLSLSSNVSCAVGNPASAAPVTMTVNALPVVSVIAGGALVVCVNGTTPAFTDATAGGTWSVTNGTGTASISSGGVVTGLTGGTVTVIYTYNNGTCSNSATKSLTVQAVSEGGSISGSTTVCEGTNSSVLTLSGNTGTIQWQSSTDNISFNDITGQTATTYTVANLNATTYYRAVVTNGACSSVNSTSATVTVTSVSEGGIINGSSTVCAGTNSSILTLSGNTGTIQWQSSTDNTSFNDIAGQTATTYTATNLNTTTYYRAVITNGSCGSAISASATITVTPESVGGSISGSSTVCAGTNSSVLTLSGNTGTIQWQSSTDNTSFNDITDQTATTYTANNLNTTTYYRAVVNGSCTVAYSSVKVITVNQKPFVRINASSVSIFKGESITLTGSGATSYLWSPVDGNNGINSDMVTLQPAVTTTYTVTGTDFNNCSNSANVLVTVNENLISLNPGLIGSDQQVCSGTVPAAIGSITNADGGNGTILYQWQQSSDSLVFTAISGSISATYTPGSLVQTTYYRRQASTDNNTAVYTNTVKVAVLALPVINDGIQGVCTMIAGTSKNFSVAATLNATSYTWELPIGWKGSSTTNSIDITAGNTNGTIRVTPYNGTCAGTGTILSVSLIDFSRVTIAASDLSIPGDNSKSATVTIHLMDTNGNPINCSGGEASFCTNSGIFTAVVDHHDGTYTSQVRSSANSVVVCGEVGGVKIQQTVTISFTGPQVSISSNGSIFSTETPKLTFSISGGNSPYTVVYKAGNKSKNDSLKNVVTDIPVDLAMISNTTGYRIVSVIGSDGRRRDNNFTKDSCTITVIYPKIVVTLKADPPKQVRDSVYSTRLSVKVKNIGDVDLNSVQVRANLHDVFPSPCDFVLDSVIFKGSNIIRNHTYDGVNTFDLFAWNMVTEQQNYLVNQPMTLQSAISTAYTQIPNSTMSTLFVDEEVPTVSFNNTLQLEFTEPLQNELPTLASYTSSNFSGTISQLSIGEEGDISLYVSIKPNGYTKPFVMQVAAVGTGYTPNATALANSISNDNANTDAHPEVTKQGEPLPTVIAIIPNPMIGVSLQTLSPVLLNDGSYDVTLNYVLQNYGNVNLSQVSLIQNLSHIIIAPALFFVKNVTTNTGSILINPAYDGLLDSNLLAANSTLGLNQSGDLQLVINIKPGSLQSLIRIQAIGKGYFDDLNILTTDLSTDGITPDPDNDQLPYEHLVSYITINQLVPKLISGEVDITGSVVSGDVNTKSYCGPANAVALVETSPVTGGFDTYQYQWQQSTDNSKYIDIANATDITYTTGDVITDIYLRRTVISGNQIEYTKPVHIIIRNVILPIISAQGETELAPGATVLLITGAGVSYQWSTGDTSQNLLANSAGKYWVNVTDSNGCTAMSGIISITPPAPITNNATYILGAISNPTNISSLVKSTVAGASVNYYTTATCITKINTPELPSTVGCFTYYVSQTVEGVESRVVQTQITMIKPASVTTLQKSVTKSAELQSDGSFLIGFTFRSANLSKEILSTVQITDDLSRVFLSSMRVEVASLKASGGLMVNPFYDGFSHTDLLDARSWLPSLQSDSIELILKVFPNGFSGVLANIAKQETVSPYGNFSIYSVDPLEVNTGLFVGVPTKFNIPVVDFFIPNAFSPNHDGKNDTYVIIKPFGTKIAFEVFNRWGNRVFQSVDYNNEWEGKGNQANRVLGDDLPDGTYYYIITATDKTSIKINRFKGFITLKR